MTVLQTALVSPISVTYSNPGEKRVQDNIYLGDIPDAKSSIPVMRAARKKREEDYLVEVIVDSFRGGDDSQSAETAAFNLFAAVEDALANDPQLGVTTEPTLRLTLDHWKLKVSFDMAREGWAAKITIEIRVQTRLQ